MHWDSGAEPSRPVGFGRGDLPEVLTRPARRSMPINAKGPPPAKSQVTGPSSRGGWGIRTPEGFHPTRFPSASTGGGKRSPLYVPAGQRGARMVRATPGSSWIGKNCYRNCYQGRARATARQSRVGHHGSGVALDAPTGPRPIAGRPELVGRSGDRLRVEPDAVAAVVAARAVRVGARGGTEDRQ